MGRKEHEPRAAEEHYQQMAFEAMEDLTPPEMLVDRCRVMTQPTYGKKDKAYRWDCLVRALPVLFDLDQDKEYHLHATVYASKANKEHVKLGDIIAVRGTLSTQEVALQDGTTQTIYHLAVSHLTVIDRAPRQPNTIFDAKNGI